MVQGLLSLQVWGVPIQTPLTQISLIVHGLPSSQTAPLVQAVTAFDGVSGNLKSTFEGLKTEFFIFEMFGEASGKDF